MNWKEKLTTLTSYFNETDDLPDPLYLYIVDPPSKEAWPANLPSTKDIEEFYSVTNGGEFGPMIRFLYKEELVKENEMWTDTLSDYDEKGSIIDPQKHLVFANDSDGAPWILNTETGEVGCFYWKGGDWCETFTSFSDFMNYVFKPDEKDPDWIETLKITGIEV